MRQSCQSRLEATTVASARPRSDIRTMPARIRADICDFSVSGMLSRSSRSAPMISTDAFAPSASAVRVMLRPARTGADQAAAPGISCGVLSWVMRRRLPLPPGRRVAAAAATRPIEAWYARALDCGTR